MSKKSVVLTVGRQKVQLSNLQKPLYPGGFTKGQMIDYYGRIAGVMLPHLKDRPVTLKRYPDGVNSIFFYEKNCPSHRPPWVKTASVAKPGDEGPAYCLINGAPELLWAANLAAIELHVPMATAKAPDRPTMMVFDFDPGPPAGMRDCLRLALKFRELLADIGLEAFAKTSGGKGLHLYVPFNSRSVTFPQTKEFAHALALKLEKEDPAKVTATMSKAVRTGKIFVDWSQNDRHKTTVCAYALRAKEEPSVSTPVTWKEVEKALRSKSATPLAFSPQDVLDRVEKLGDLFAPVLSMKQKMPKIAAA